MRKPAHAAEPTVLNPDGYFQIPSSRSAGIRDFVADETGLYFLLQAPGYSEVMHTDRRGKLIKVVSVPDGVMSTAIRVNGRGEIAVLRPGKSSVSVAVFDSRGRLMQQVSRRGGIADVAWFKGRLIALDTTAAVLRNEPGGTLFAKLEPPPSWASFLLNVGDRKLALIEQGIPALRIIDSEAVGYPVILAAPEIVPSTNLQLPADTVKILVDKAAVDGQGNILVLGIPLFPR
jgi:hypothetical protein